MPLRPVLGMWDIPMQSMSCTFGYVLDFVVSPSPQRYETSQWWLPLRDMHALAVVVVFLSICVERLMPKKELGCQMFSRKVTARSIAHANRTLILLCCGTIPIEEMYRCL